MVAVSIPLSGELEDLYEGFQPPNYHVYPPGYQPLQPSVGPSAPVSEAVYFGPQGPPKSGKQFGPANVNWGDVAIARSSVPKFHERYGMSRYNPKFGTPWIKSGFFKPHKLKQRYEDYYPKQYLGKSLAEYLSSIARGRFWSKPSPIVDNRSWREKRFASKMRASRFRRIVRKNQTCRFVPKGRGYRGAFTARSGKKGYRRRSSVCV